MYSEQEYAAREAEVMRAADHEEALRLSADLLAKTDEQLRLQLNARAVQPQAAGNFGRACALHCDLLLGGGMASDCYATALTGLLVLDMAFGVGAGADNQGDATQTAEPQPTFGDMTMPSTLSLTTLGLTAFGELAAQMPHDEFSERHVPALYTLWASRLYILYQTADKSQVVLRHLVQAAHQMLQALIEADVVKWPDVDIEGRAVPAMSSEALGDILARSIALGYLGALNF